jgi:16S rRNA (cytosine967-C5)-methyltransferase
MVDAPCSGLGALRRRPEARWRKRPADIAELRPLQRALLDSALAAVAPGGIVAYVTCSPHVAESRQIVAEVLRDSAGTVRSLPTASILAGLSDTALPGIDPDATEVQLWPHTHGTDAMFIALLTRD